MDSSGFQLDFNGLPLGRIAFPMDFPWTSNGFQWVGNGFLIPSGPLRERLSSIKRADCIVINGDKDN